MNNIPTLPDADIDLLASHFGGKRREKFLASIEVIRESLAQETWVRRGSQRAGKGLTPGISSRKSINQLHFGFDDPRREPMFRVYMAAAYGSHLTESEAATPTDAELVALAPKVPCHVTRAWLRLMVAVSEICTDLDASRPLPVYTEIGLSRRVTKTLTDVGLDLDLTTRRLCPLGWRWETVIGKDGTPIVRHGQPVRQKVYFPKWPRGIKFGTSRFAHSDCEACGKSIPSRTFVPVIVADHSGTEHGFWFGRDCAANILGIKDAGISK